MKHYIGQIETRNGDYQDTCTIRFVTDKDPEEFLDTIAMRWYDDENDGADKIDDWYWHNGEVVVRGGAWETVDAKTYEAMPYFLTKFKDGDTK
tara:strand:+ start:2297 stop:2575 length:279 start_codon:yes stop_codon:yes gene_type:complete